MENIRIAIVTGEREYGRALSRSLLNVSKDFIIKIFDSRQFIKETAGSLSKEAVQVEAPRQNGGLQLTEQSQQGPDSMQNAEAGQVESGQMAQPQLAFCGKFDIVLWDGDEIRQSYGGNIVHLAEKASLTIRDYKQKKFCLYKYSTAQTMVAAIFEIYSFLTGRKAWTAGTSGVRLFAFASWAGGTGCSTVTMAVGQELCRFRKTRILYLSFEDVESTLDFIDGAEGIRDAGEYLYRLFRDRERILPPGAEVIQSPFLDGYVIRDPYGLEAFMPTQGKNPIRGITGSEMQIFMESLMNSGRYDMILMDMGSCLDQAAITAMQMAEKICIVTNEEGGVESHREEAYYRQLIYRCDEKVLEKSFKLINRAKAGATLAELAKNEAAMLQIRALVPESEQSVSRKGRKGIVLENDFGQRIVEIVEMLVNPSLNMV